MTALHIPRLALVVLTFLMLCTMWSLTAEANTGRTEAVNRLIDNTGRNLAQSPGDTTYVDENGIAQYNPSGELPTVHAAEVNNKIKRVGNDTVGFFMNGAEYLAILIFIISAILMALGAIMKGDWFKRGVFGMGIAILMWTCILFAPDLLNFFSEWLAA